MDTQTLPTRKQDNSKRRKKLWELEHRFHCSIVVTCLTLEELRKLCKKSGIRLPQGMTDYELHCSFTSAIAQPARLAKVTQKFLDHKFASAVRRFQSAKNPQTLTALWQNAYEQGEVAGAFWAAATHPQSNEDFAFVLFGDVHMLSHLQGASLRIDLEHLAQLKRQTRELQQALKKSQEQSHLRLEARDREIKALKQQLEMLPDLKQRMKAAEWQIHNWHNGQSLARLQDNLKESKAHCSRLVNRCDRLTKQITYLKEQLSCALQENQSLSETIHREQSERLSLEHILNGLILNEIDPPDNLDLAGRRILYVGGLRRQWRCFKALVERYQGQLLTHDGGREDSPGHLQNLLARVDWVICPLDQVSHDAVQRIKRSCQRRGQPCLLQPTASLSTFVRGLRELSQSNAGDRSWPVMSVM